MKTSRNKFILVLSLIAVLFTTGCPLLFTGYEDDPEIIPNAIIMSLSDEYGMRGSTITVNGSGFHSSAIVYFGDVAATPTSIKPNTIVVTVPDEVVAGDDFSIMQSDVSTKGPSYHVFTPAKTLFFTEYFNDQILKIDLINTPKESELLFDIDKGMPEGPVGLALSDDGFLYITTDYFDQVLKMAQDGSGVVDMLYDFNDGVIIPTAIAIDNENDMLYWTNNEGGQKIMKASANGTGSPSALLFDGNPAFSFSHGLKLDVANGEFYLGDFDNPSIKKGNMDGTGTPEVLYNPDNFSDLNAPSAIFIDPIRGKIYWTDLPGIQIIEANIDGSGTPVILFDVTDGLQRPAGIAVDYASSKVYWSDNKLGIIYRGNLDGTGTPEALVDADYSYSMVLEF